MINLVSLTLVLASLVTGGVLSPSSQTHNHDHNQVDVIVKDGHRVVVVEYEKQGPDVNTKVLISPSDKQLQGSAPSAINVASSVEELGEEAKGLLSAPRELICDAFGKCKHKIAVALGRSKEAVVGKAHQVSDKLHEAEEHAKEAAIGAKEKVADEAHQVFDKMREVKEEAAGKAHQVYDKMHASDAKEKVADEAHQVFDKMREGKDKVADKAHQVFDKMSVSDAIDKAKDSLSHAGEDVSAKTQEALEKVRVPDKVKDMLRDSEAKMKSFDVVDSPKRMGEDIEGNVTEKIKDAKESIKEKEKEAEEAVGSTVKEGKKSMKDIMRRGREVVYDAVEYVTSPEMVGPVLSVLHLMGFSVAYGMCVWVTFVSSYVLSRALPRQQFAMVQSKIYPVYFKAMGFCVGVALLGHLLTHRKRISTSVLEMFQGCNLFLSLLMVMANLIYLEPRASKVIFERMKIEKEEGRGVIADGDISGSGAVQYDIPGPATLKPGAVTTGERGDLVSLNENLKKLNDLSSLLNVLTLVFLTWHMTYMGQSIWVTQ